MGRTYNKTCEECGDPFVARTPNQRECDSCWGAERGAVRVEYLITNGGRSMARHAVVVCTECDTEYATTGRPRKRPGMCGKCSRAAAHRDPAFRENMAAKKRGTKLSPHKPETLLKMSASMRRAQAQRKQRGAEQGGMFGWLYVVAGEGKVKVGGSMDADTLADRLRKHATNGLADVCGTWQVDPADGSTLEAQALAAVLSEWDQVGTTVLPHGGTETVWCDDPGAVVAVIDQIVSQRVA